jgi:hypothetical protein
MSMTGPAPSAGGNLAHTATNDHRFADLLTKSEELGIQAGQGADVQIKHLLTVTQAAYEGVIDNTEGKHPGDEDDATVIAAKYWSARNKNVRFDPKAGNQRKTISCIRQCIGLGGWSKGGPGEPLGMINRSMTIYQNMRKDPNSVKKLIDAANYLILIARRMKGSDHLLDDDELRSLALKKDPDAQTVEDVLDSVRGTLTKLYNGKHRAGTCASDNVKRAISALNKELKEVADGRRSADVQEAAADIEAEANAQEKAEGAASANAA